MPIQELVKECNLPSIVQTEDVKYGTTIIAIMLPQNMCEDVDRVKKTIKMVHSLYNYMKVERKKIQNLEETSKIHIFVANGADEYDDYMAAHIKVKENKRVVIVMPPDLPEFSVSILSKYINRDKKDIENYYRDHCDNIGVCMLVCDKVSVKSNKHNFTIF